MVSELQIEKAVHILRAGGLVAFPTETVYGLGADATSAAAVRKIFAAKGRPADHPVIVHLADMSGLKTWAAEVPRSAWLLAEAFWPGPLTIILKRAPQVTDVVTGGQDSVGLRVPSHTVARQLLHAFGGGIAAPSANRFGQLSPTTAEHVREALGDAVDLILDAGPCPVGIESTIVDLTSARPVILRPGKITALQIADALLTEVGTQTAQSPRAPGTLQSHYAPRTPLKLVHPDDVEVHVRKELPGVPVAVLARRSRPQNTRAALWQVAPDTHDEYAHHLYALLRRLDDTGCKVIIVESPPDLPEWFAVRDRLNRASSAGASIETAATGT